MSDVGQGPGWWQAPDGKWYRPESSRDALARRRNGTGCLPIVAGGMLVIVLIGIFVVATHRTSGRARGGGTTSSSVASTATTAAAATTTPPITYRVKRGDSLTKIAAQFHVPISAIVSRNHIANPNRLGEGQILVIPPAPPLKLKVTPSQGQAGQAFQLELTGAVPSETIRFEIDSAAHKYTGGPHTASADGAVTATYLTDLAAPTGVYRVTATGNMRTTVRAVFVVVAAPRTGST